MKPKKIKFIVRANENGRLGNAEVEATLYGEQFAVHKTPVAWKGFSVTLIYKGLAFLDDIKTLAEAKKFAIFLSGKFGNQLNLKPDPIPQLLLLEMAKVARAFLTDK